MTLMTWGENDALDTDDDDDALTDVVILSIL